MLRRKVSFRTSPTVVVAATTTTNMTATQLFIRRLCLVSILACLLNGQREMVDGTRVRLHPDEEPDTRQVFNMYRTIFADPNLYYLSSAGLLEDSHIGPELLDDKPEADGGYAKFRFQFNSSEILRKASVLKWYIPLEERSAMHVYDDPHDIELARGPQVDQQLCGLHLDYMLHMTEKYYKNLMDSREFSIFYIMQSFDVPTLGLGQGNTVFPGNYDSCMISKLNVMKRELLEVNRSAAKQYFKMTADERRGLKGGDKEGEEPQQQLGAIATLFGTIRNYLGPLVGYSSRRKRVSMKKYQDKLRKLPMRYCLAGLRWPQWSNSSFYRRNFILRTATCLPETCDSSSLAIHGDKIKRLTDFSMTNYHSGYYIDQLYCLPDEKSSLRNPFNYTSTNLFILFNVVWIGLLVVASAMFYLQRRDSANASPVEGGNDVRSRDTMWRSLLNSWCIQRNVLSFLAPNRVPQEPAQSSKHGAGSSESTSSKRRANKVDLEPLEGFKVVSSLTVILSHACMMAFGASWNPVAGHKMLTKSWLGMMLVVCPAVVDNFFVVTGVVVAKILFSTPRKILLTFNFWIKFILYRYIRIVPLYFLMHWFLKSSFRFTGSGPYWDYGTSHTGLSKVCQQESWWAVILPSANLKSPAIHCNGVGWYLANDVQLTLITPFLIVLYLKKPILAHVTIVVSVFAIMANHVRYYLETDSEPRGVFEWSMMTLTKVTDDTADGYVNPQYRCLSYITGIAAGHLLHWYSIGLIKKWPRWTITYGKVFLYFNAYMLCFLPYLTSLLPLDNEPLVRILAALFNGLAHGVTSLATAVFLLLLCTGHLPWFSNIYSLRFLRPLANTALSTLLVHIPLMYYHVQIRRNMPELTAYNFIVSNFIWTVESYVIALFLHVLYELPMRKFLVKLLIFSATGDDQRDNKEIQNEQVKTKVN